MRAEWLLADEKVLGDWAVYIGEANPGSPKTTGRLYVTDRRVVFAAGLDLAENAGAYILSRRKAFTESDQLRAIPRDQIHAAEIVKKKLILKSLLLTLRSGEPIEFQFGAASPVKALDLIKEMINR